MTVALAIWAVGALFTLVWAHMQNDEGGEAELSVLALLALSALWPVVLVVAIMEFFRTPAR